MIGLFLLHLINGTSDRTGGGGGLTSSYWMGSQDKQRRFLP